MPVTRITTNFVLENRDAMIDEIHQTFQDILKIKSHDRLMIVNEKPSYFYQPLNTTGRYILIEIEMFNGRTLNTKRKLYQTLVELMKTFDIPENNIRIAIIEIPMENWGVRGGQAACDIDLGYQTNI